MGEDVQGWHLLLIALVLGSVGVSLLLDGIDKAWYGVLSPITPKLPRWVGLTIALMILVLLFSGLFLFSLETAIDVEIDVENHQSRDLQVYRGDRDLGWVEGCTARRTGEGSFSHNSGGSRYKIRDASNKLAYETIGQSIRVNAPRANAYIEQVIIPERRVGECPQITAIPPVDPLPSPTRTRTPTRTPTPMPLFPFGYQY